MRVKLFKSSKLFTTAGAGVDQNVGKVLGLNMIENMVWSGLSNVAQRTQKSSISTLNNKLIEILRFRNGQTLNKTGWSRSGDLLEQQTFLQSLTLRFMIKKCFFSTKVFSTNWTVVCKSMGKVDGFNMISNMTWSTLSKITH